MILVPQHGYFLFYNVFVRTEWLLEQLEHGLNREKVDYAGYVSFKFKFLGNFLT